MRVLIDGPQSGPLGYPMLDCTPERVALHADQAGRLPPNAESVASNDQSGVLGQKIVYVESRLEITHAVVEQQGGWSHNGTCHDRNGAERSAL